MENLFSAMSKVKISVHVRMNTHYYLTLFEKSTICISLSGNHIRPVFLYFPASVVTLLSVTGGASAPDLRLY